MENNNLLPIIGIGFIAIVFTYILVNTESNNSKVSTLHNSSTSYKQQNISDTNPVTSIPEGQFDCSRYQNDLYKITNSTEDLIEIHRASGVIKQVDEDEKYYVVIINPTLWKQTTAEQRQLIRCSTTEIAKSKGKEGGIIDPLKNERLY